MGRDRRPAGRLEPSETLADIATQRGRRTGTRVQCVGRIRLMDLPTRPVRRPTLLDLLGDGTQDGRIGPARPLGVQPDVGAEPLSAHGLGPARNAVRGFDDEFDLIRRAKDSAKGNLAHFGLTVTQVKPGATR